MALRRDGYAGAILIVGAERHPPYERPPLSKSQLLGELPLERTHFRHSAAYKSAGIELSLGCSVEQIDLASSSAVLDDGRAIPFSQCILATGALARSLPVPGGDLGGVFVLRTLDHCERLRTALASGRRVVIAGGGYLGLEVAASARKLGAEVTLVEAASRLLVRSASQMMAGALLERQRAAGVKIVLEETITGVTGERAVESVILSSGRGVEADVLIVAIGAAPQTMLAERAAITCSNGVVVDEFCRTSTAGIYAIGDCASRFEPRYGRHLRFESVQSATYQARCASASIMGKPLPTARPPYFWSEQFDAKVQIAGFADPARPCDDAFVGDHRSFAVYRMQDGVLAAVETLNRPQDFVRAQTIIGTAGVALPAA